MGFVGEFSPLIGDTRRIMFNRIKNGFGGGKQTYKYLKQKRRTQRIMEQGQVRHPLLRRRSG